MKVAGYTVPGATLLAAAFQRSALAVLLAMVTLVVIAAGCFVWVISDGARTRRVAKIVRAWRNGDGP